MKHSTGVRILLRACCIAVALLGVLSASGCTAIGALTGGTVGLAIDSVVITSPLWAASAKEQSDQEDIHKKVRAHDGSIESMLRPPLARGERTQVILVRPLEGSLGSAGEHYRTWLSALPLFPYANVHCDLQQLSNGSDIYNRAFEYPAPAAPLQISFPIERIPEALRWEKGRPEGQDALEAVKCATRAELLVRTPTQSQLQASYAGANEAEFAWQATLSAIDGIREGAREAHVELQWPRLTGTYLAANRLSFTDYVEDLLDDEEPKSSDGKRRDGTRRAARRQFYPAPPHDSATARQHLIEDAILPLTASEVSREGDVVRVDTRVDKLRILGKCDGFDDPTTTSRVLLVSGQVRKARMEKSQILYGVTLPLANVLAIFGAPTSSARLVVEIDLTARRGANGPIVAEEMIRVETPSRVGGLYYGGDIAQDFDADLQEQLRVRFREFGRRLQELSPDPMRVAAANGW